MGAGWPTTPHRSAAASCYNGNLDYLETGLAAARHSRSLEELAATFPGPAGLEPFYAQAHQRNLTYCLQQQ